MTPISRTLNKTSFTTKLFIRTVTESPLMTTTPPIITAIKQDHREIELYYNRINKSTKRTSRRSTRACSLGSWRGIQ